MPHLQRLKINYPGLNGLRAFSIIMVVIGHTNVNYLTNLKYSWLINILANAQFGVNVFFVISGFLITTLMLDEEKSTGTVSIKKFYLRRALRIFPAYYFLLFFYFLLTHFNVITLSNKSWLTSITYTKYLNWDQDWYTAHAWSLSIEENFYLVWPLIFLAWPALRKYFIFLIILIIPMIRLIYHAHETTWINKLTICFRLDAITTGCALALYKEEIIQWAAPYWRKLFYLSITAYLGIVALTLFSYLENLNLSVFMIPFAGSFGTITNGIIALLLMYTAFGPKNNCWFKFINSGVMNQIGLWSYGIYLWQQFFIVNTDLWVNAFPVNLLLLFGTVLLSYYFIEKPFMKLKAKFAV